MCIVALGDAGQYGEGANRHASVGRNIEEQRQTAPLFTDDDGNQQIAGMRDARIREHALDARLRDRQQVTQCHRADGDQPKRENPVGIQRRKLVQQDARPGGKRGGFHGYGHETADRCGRAFVDVRHPEVKGHGADFKREADEKEKTAADQIDRPVARLFNQKIGDQIEIGRSRCAVDQSDAVEEKTGGKSAHEKIFHRRFARPLARAPHAGENVNGNGHRL